jgi:hypothetical protein
VGGRDLGWRRLGSTAGFGLVVHICMAQLVYDTGIEGCTFMKIAINTRR